jgi:nitrous-oxide reductase
MNNTSKQSRRRTYVILGSLLALAILTPLLVPGCGTSNVGTDINSIAARRGLSPDEMENAIKTYVAPGKYDDYYIFASGGHSGQIHVIGVPSMRLLKTIPVFTPDAWNGYGFGNSEQEAMFAEGSKGEPTTLKWGDTHHPALSETNGEYDGRWIYINDRANGRIAFVDLADWKTKQIYRIPNIQTSHGGVFVTPNTEYAHISSKVPMANPFDNNVSGVTEDQHFKNYRDIYRGVSTFMHVDHSTGRLDPMKSFQVELPPYNQDLADAGKAASEGFAFLNSYNTEMATGGNAQGHPSIEVGASKNDFDYMHIIDWKKAEKLVAAGKTEMHNGMPVIRIKTAVAEGILHLVPEPKSPHGVDVAPDGVYITVSGKLDPHSTVYDIGKIKQAIAAKNYEGKDYYGIPILNYKACVAAQVELGAGPLHTQYDGQGYAYTSLFLENAVVKWSLGEPYFSGDKAWKVIDKVQVNYNIGHLAMPHGDTRKPEGKYVVAMNKWSIDRYNKIGTLLPQNFQLIDISGDKMKVIADMPIGFGEPHYAQMIRADVLKSIQTYPLGTNPMTMQRSAQSIQNAKDARVERHGNVVDVYMSVVRSTFTPDVVQAKVGDRVRFHLTNVEQTVDAIHGFAIPEYNIMLSLDPGETTTAEVVVSKPGSFSFYCTEFCSALHLEMQGWLLVSGNTPTIASK